MNDLMTKSILSYVELKKQSRMDLEAEMTDLEKGQNLSPTVEASLSQFFQEVEAIKSVMEEINSLLFDLQFLNEETKSTHSAKILRGLQDRMDSDMVSALRKAKTAKAWLQSLDKSANNDRRGAVERTRIAVTNCLRIKLRDTMNDFQSMRDRIVSDRKDYLRRRYYNTTGEAPTEEAIEEMMRVEVFEGRAGLNLENKERHEAVMDIQRSLNNLHQVFLDMAVLVETQGEKIGDIEQNVAMAGSFIGGGTDSLFYAKQMKKKGRKWGWCCWVFAVVVIILLVCLIASLTS